MKILKAKVEPGSLVLRILVDRLPPDSGFIYTELRASHYPGRLYFAESGGEARFCRDYPGGATEPWGHVSLPLKNGGTRELDPKPVDEGVINDLAAGGVGGFTEVVQVVLSCVQEGGAKCSGVKLVTLEFALKAAKRAGVALKRELYGWDWAYWRWVVEVAK